MEVLDLEQRWLPMRLWTRVGPGKPVRKVGWNNSIYRGEINPAIPIYKAVYKGYTSISRRGPPWKKRPRSWAFSSLKKRGSTGRQKIRSYWVSVTFQVLSLGFQTPWVWRYDWTPKRPQPKRQKNSAGMNGRQGYVNFIEGFCTIMASQPTPPRNMALWWWLICLWFPLKFWPY